MVRVLHLIKSLGRGGAEKLIPETIHLHKKGDYEFHVGYFLPWKDQMVGAIEKEGGKVYCFEKSKSWRMLSSVDEIWTYCQKHQIDLIHAHLPWAGITARRLYKKYGIPLIYTEHNKQERYHFITKWMNRVTFNYQTLAIAVSEDVRLSIIKNINPTVKVKTILNGVNTDKFKSDNYDKPSLRKTSGIPEDAIVIGTVAVFRKQKRLVKWIDLAAKIKKQLPNSFFVILGDGPEEEEVKNKIEYERLSNSVLLPGRLEEVRPWLGLMDIYMITSEFEGLPIALLEAMSMQLPVVTTDAGGIKEVVRNDEEGYLVPVDSPDSILEHIIKLANDQNLRDNMGAKANTRVVNEFSLQRMISELEISYSKVLDNEKNQVD